MMWGVIVGLIPVVLASIYFFRIRAIILLASCITVSLLAETVFQKMRGKPFSLRDGSAVLTGALLALTLPPGLSPWQACLGSLVAIGLGKQIFGGLGYNIFNPALVGRAFLMAAFPVHLTTWNEPFSLDAVTGASPLGLMKFQHLSTPWLDLFFGNVAGSLGETSGFLILIGALYVIVKGYSDWRIPLSFLFTVASLAAVTHFLNPLRYPDTAFHLFSGGLLLGACFMATDPVTTPVTKMGRWIFGCGCGLIVIVIRLWGGLPEGVMYSILIMNAASPLINRFTRPRRFGR
jgi:electron transport complex protein RnfD